MALAARAPQALPFAAPDDFWRNFDRSSLSSSASSSFFGFSQVYPVAADCASGSGPSLVFGFLGSPCPMACTLSRLTGASISTACVNKGDDLLAYGGSLFGRGATYIAQVIYDDNACTSLFGALFVKADGGCYTGADVGAFRGVTATVDESGSQVVLKTYGTVDCSGPVKNTTTTGTAKCRDMISYTLVVNGVAASEGTTSVTVPTGATTSGGSVSQATTNGVSTGTASQTAANSVSSRSGATSKTAGLVGAFSAWSIFFVATMLLVVMA